MRNSHGLTLRWLVTATAAFVMLLLPGSAFAATGPTTPRPAGNVGFTVIPHHHSPTPSPKPTPASSAGLPDMGGPSLWWLGAGAALVLAGAGVVVASQRTARARH